MDLRRQLYVADWAEPDFANGEFFSCANFAGLFFFQQLAQ
jgi:hypothetical protein